MNVYIKNKQTVRCAGTADYITDGYVYRAGTDTNNYITDGYVHRAGTADYIGEGYNKGGWAASSNIIKEDCEVSDLRSNINNKRVMDQRRARFG